MTQARLSWAGPTDQLPGYLQGVCGEWMRLHLCWYVFDSQLCEAASLKTPQRLCQRTAELTHTWKRFCQSLVTPPTGWCRSSPHPSGVKRTPAVALEACSLLLACWSAQVHILLGTFLISECVSVCGLGAVMHWQVTCDLSCLSACNLLQGPCWAGSVLQQQATIGGWDRQGCL